MNIKFPTILLFFISLNLLSQDNGKSSFELSRLKLPGDQTHPLFSNSGKFLAYRSNEKGMWQVCVRDLQTGQDFFITDSENDHKDIRWSPDDRFLSFSSINQGKSRVITYELASAQADTLTTFEQNASNARWSKDGSSLVMDFQGEVKDIWELDLTKKTFKQITSMEGEESNFGYSYDGKWIGYRSRGTGFPHLHAIHQETGEVKRLVEKQKGFEWHPRWSEKEFEVTFYSTWNDEMTDIWITDGTPEGLTRITDKKVEEFGPALNYKEDLVAFFTWNKTNDISIYNRKDGIQKNLGLNQKMVVKWNPLSWSPVENSLAFLAWNQKDRIYTVSATKGNDSKLLMPERTNAHEIHSNWSSDGRFLLFSEEQNVVVKDLTTFEETILSPDQDHFIENYPTWLPGSNEYISFILEVGGASDTNNIWMMKRDGTDKKQLTDFGGIKNFCWIDEKQLVFGYDSDTSYSNYDIWIYELGAEKPFPLLIDPNATLVPSAISPDGKQLLFTANFSGNQKIYKMSLDTKQYEVLNTSKETSKMGKFSPDGRQIVFLSNDNPEKTHDIYVIPSQGGAPKRLTNSQFEEYGLTWSADGSQIIYSANFSDKDIYILDLKKP